MRFEEDEELEEGYKMGGGEEDEPLDMPEDLDFGHDDDDPEDRYH